VVFVEGKAMVHDVIVTRADGSVRKFRIFGRAALHAGEMVTLPIDGRLVKARIDKTSGAESVGTVDRVDTVEMEPA
jgi:hypothetical protein